MIRAPLAASGDARIHVLMMIDWIGDDAAGAERFAIGLASALPKDRYAVTMCATRRISGELPNTLIDAGVRLFGLERGDGFRPQAFRRLGRYLRDERVDVLHAHKFGSNVWGALLGALARVPVIVTHEQTWSYEGQPVRRLLDRHLIARASSAFVAVSSRDAERMQSVEKVPAEKIVVIPNAYIPRPPGPRSDLRGELDLAADTPLLVTGAFLRPQKALEVMIDAVAELAQRVPDTQLAIAGVGPCEEALKAHARSAGVADRVHFLGLRPDMDGILEAGDIAVMSSDYEGTPLFVLECMAHGTPVVSTDVGGVRDLLEEERSVLLAPPRDPAALAAQLERAIVDPQLRRSLADRARERLDELTIERITARFSELYDRLLAERAAARNGGPRRAA